MEILVDPRPLVPRRILAWQQVSNNDSHNCRELNCHRQKAYCLTVLIPILSAIYFLINKKPMLGSRFLVEFPFLFTNFIILY